VSVFQNLIANALRFRHGGRIWLDTSYTGGTCVRFTLPMANEARA
jgi:signal transduction histidine kinase